MITAALVKELRDLTGAGILDSKKALVETDGDIEKAVIWLREKGMASAAKKSGRIAAEGLSKVVFELNRAVIVEINSETDFVAKNELFLELLEKVSMAILFNKPASVEEALELEFDGKKVSELITNATSVIGEKISLRRFDIINKNENEVFGVYMHMGGKISAVAVLENADEEMAKDIAMQVASMSPTFISREYMDATFIEKERNIQISIADNDESLKGKPEKVLQGIVEGRLNKSLKDISLVDQVYFKDPGLNVEKYLKTKDAKVVNFVRYAVGEGIEKREDDFAAEVMAQVASK